jgi:hypothetical protein
MHLGTFGDVVVTVEAPWQGAVQRAPDPSAGYNFDTYITNPKTGALIAAKHLGGTRYRVFMGTPECPGCHFGRGLEVDILGQNPALIFGPTLIMMGGQLLASRAASVSAAASMTGRSGAGFTPRVIQGGGGVATTVGTAPPAFAGNAALQLQPSVAQAPVASLSLVPSPAPVPPPVYLPNPALPAVASIVAAAPTVAPPQTQPGMPPNLTPAEQQLWRTCNQQHNTYKATQAEASAYAPRMDPLEQRLMNNRATPQERIDFCALLDERIRLVQRLHRERLQYMRLNCDRFDWFTTGTTPAARLAQHQIELDNVSAQLRNLYESRTRLCP